MGFKAKSFACALGRAPYCELKRQISSWTAGVWRSLRITDFGTNQGVLVIMCKASMLELEAVPQRSLAWLLFCRLGVCCSWRVWIYVQVTSTFCWVWDPVVSVLRECVYARWVCCSWRVRIYVQVTSTFCWLWDPVMSVLSAGIYPRWVSCQGAVQDIWHLFEGIVRYLYGRTFLCAW
jgi:hypothetical protein